ncbi:MAG: 30S ribosomal protein S8 [Flavobacteriaceae bacterium]|jgi:small subunit ribosomal protein S8|nr:30S ribosomal protein S8 [Flavobacteriaceae bacterium]MCH1430966.1 30S ribosomal protein S8 [Flavobacteriaceae bacterium]MDC1012056.1 30S ribosomal protein S8 [Flavobacteriaceae bacterium]MDG1190484.1 30S ribosomal protein S8 [Flavobacteriaceae bacterium]MDG1919871.1 30S ribosomal protein S8 [Flavobacteriaceae bacterium]
MFTDPIADYLTRIRNANRAGHRVVDIPASNIKKEITKILFDQGYILSYKFEETENNQGNIKIALKYDQVTKEPVIKKLQRISTPGLRQYSASDSLPRILNGLGISIVSTSKGVMTGKQATKENVGGELICYVY